MSLASTSYYLKVVDTTQFHNSTNPDISYYQLIAELWIEISEGDDPIFPGSSHQRFTWQETVDRFPFEHKLWHNPTWQGLTGLDILDSPVQDMCSFLLSMYISDGTLIPGTLISKIVNYGLSPAECCFSRTKHDVSKPESGVVDSLKNLCMHSNSNKTLLWGTCFSHAVAEVFLVQAHCSRLCCIVCIFVTCQFILIYFISFYVTPILILPAV